MYITWIAVSWASDQSFLEYKMTDEEIAEEAFWMNEVDLVVVATPVTPPLGYVPYIGPQGVAQTIQSQPLAIQEALLGSVASGYIELWGHEDSAPSLRAPGIVFLRRWHLENAFGNRLPTLSPTELIASDAAYTISMRRLHFVDGLVTLFNGTFACIAPTAIFRTCQRGESPATQEEALDHLRKQLAGRPGLDLPGLDPSLVPPPAQTGWGITPVRKGAGWAYEEAP